MKNFLKTVLAVVVALLIVNIIGIMIIGAIASSSSKPTTPTTGILKLDLSKVIISEQATQTLSLSSDNTRTTLGLRKVLSAVEKAAVDPNVKCIYLKPEGAIIGMAELEELRSALANFRLAGKAVIAYIENPTTGNIYLSSVADKVYMGKYEGGTPQFVGVSSQLMFLGDALEKLGINVQLIRHGKYKSAGEMYIRSSASQENLYQNQVMINSVWNSLAQKIATSRDLTIEQIDKAINNLELCTPEDFVKAGLVDELLDRKGLEDKLAVMAHVDNYDNVSFIPFATYTQNLINNNYRSSKRIAIIYANGSIVDGYDPMNVDGDRFASIIEEVRKDSTIKAVVLRVNSPGGSVVASDKIRTELDRLSEVKPLVASFGDYAASGGYWISTGADKIYADQTTLTGSIGVFGMVPDLSKLYKETLHVGVQSVSSHEHGDMYSLARPFTKAELAYTQRSIENIYKRFVELVSEGRDLSFEQVDNIAQGRVWTGADALKIGLVDEIGGLNEALCYAAASGGDALLGNWQITEYPRELTVVELLTEALSGAVNDYSVRSNWANFYKNWFESYKKANAQTVFATMPYIPIIK